jgi:2-iminobutanoate/2-iminopropanoate deaminase
VKQVVAKESLCLSEKNPRRYEMSKRVLQPLSVMVKGHYSPGWEVTGGKLIFVAGQIPWDSEGRTVAKGDVESQTRQVYRNIQAVLAEADASLDDVIKVTIFLRDIRHRDIVNRVRGEFFKPPYPASSQVAVASLVDPDWLVEIEAVAIVSS